MFKCQHKQLPGGLAGFHSKELECLLLQPLRNQWSCAGAGRGPGGEALLSVCGGGVKVVIPDF